MASVRRLGRPAFLCEAWLLSPLLFPLSRTATVVPVVTAARAATVVPAGTVDMGLGVSISDSDINQHVSLWLPHVHTLLGCLTCTPSSPIMGRVSELDMHFASLPSNTYC